MFPNNRGKTPPKWMVENHGKPYFLMDDLGGKTHYFSETSKSTNLDMKSTGIFFYSDLLHPEM